MEEVFSYSSDVFGSSVKGKKAIIEWDMRECDRLFSQLDTIIQKYRTIKNAIPADKQEAYEDAADQLKKWEVVYDYAKDQCQMISNYKSSYKRNSVNAAAINIGSLQNYKHWVSSFFPEEEPGNVNNSRSVASVESEVKPMKFNTRKSRKHRRAPRKSRRNRRNTRKN